MMSNRELYLVQVLLYTKNEKYEGKLLIFWIELLPSKHLSLLPSPSKRLCDIPKTPS